MKFAPDMADLPLAIHGKQGSGASLFSVKLAASLAGRVPLVFWSAYPMAKEEFRKGLEGKPGVQVEIVADEDPKSLGQILEEVSPGSVLCVKNFETMPAGIRREILERKLLVIAGDLERALDKEQVLGFPTRIFFSPFPGIPMPALDKYQGWLVSRDKSGAVDIASLAGGG